LSQSIFHQNGFGSPHKEGKSGYESSFPTVKMAIQITLENIAKTLMQQITEVISTVAPRHNVADPAALTQDILVGLGLVDLKIDPVAAVAAVAAPKPKAAPKPRKKKTETVTVVAPAAPVPVANPASAAPVPVANPASAAPAAPPPSPAPGAGAGAAEVEAPPPLPAPADVPALMKEIDEVLGEEKKPKKPRAKKEKIEGEEEKPKKPRAKKAEEKKKGRMDKWTAASIKVFKTIVEENGATMTDTLKTEFVTWLDELTEENFAATSIQGHMRAYITIKNTAPAAPTLPADELETVD